MRYVLLFISFPLTIGIGGFCWLASYLLSGASSRMFSLVVLMYCLGFFGFSIINSIVPKPDWAQAIGLAGLFGMVVVLLRYF